MKTTITPSGFITIESETDLESYALRQLMKEPDLFQKIVIVAQFDSKVEAFKQKCKDE